MPGLLEENVVVMRVVGVGEHDVGVAVDEAGEDSGLGEVENVCAGRDLDLIGGRDAGDFFAVDDDASMQEALSRLFRSVGMRARIFSSAEEFLTFERPDAPACLVLDVRLPGLSGLELQRELAEVA